MGELRRSRYRSALIGSIALALASVPFASGGFPLVAQSSRAGCDLPASGSSPLSEWLDLLSGQGGPSIDALMGRAEPLIGRTLALESMSERILGDEWSRLRGDQRQEFIRAFTISLHDGLASFLRDEMGGRVPVATPDGEDGERGIATFALQRPGGRARRLTVHLDAGGGGSCGIVDVEYDGDGLVSEMRRRVEDLLHDYSFRYMIAELGNYDEMMIDDFESSPVGSFPIGWDQRADDNAPPYHVREENGNRYLAATDEGESVIIGLETPWNLDEYPYISFRLRVNRIPEGANERDDRLVDSAAGVYVTVKKVAFGRIPESVKYVWSSTLPVGAATQRSGVGRPWQIVIGSGREGLGEWHTYVFDIRDAYRKTFGGNPGSKPAGIGILSDANSVGGQAWADYDDFKVLKRAPPGTDGGVRERLRPLSGR